MPERVCGRAARRCLLLALSLAVLPACPRDEQPTARLMAIATEKDALREIEQFFGAYVVTDIDTTARMICEQDPESLARLRSFIQHSQAPGSMFRVERFQVRSAVPMWIGKEPYYRVEVSFPRRNGPGEILHQYRLRVRDGCIEGFLEPGPGPRPAPPPVGSGAYDDDEEMLGEPEATGDAGVRVAPPEMPAPAPAPEDPNAIIEL